MRSKLPPEAKLLRVIFSGDVEGFTYHDVIAGKTLREGLEEMKMERYGEQSRGKDDLFLW